ncbi:methionine--tRNA ligase, mitochondrial [Phlebotomus argentipes]|uniref:methionine--tRNA ligase, mitochondrial n=1 Tax=Phlebotomus argentipes TaxID=94469 RepID=UPI002892BB6E|nr:methionine--tRNA ligase, mitochondrial [Phlebotomus argentipes]
MILRRFSSASAKPFFVSTPIFYVNAAPHIGHLYSAVITDAIFRFENLLRPNPENLFTTGTDEHGTKIQQAAAQKSIPVEEYCKTVSGRYKSLFGEMGVNYTDFIRTSEKRHFSAVEKFWLELKKRDWIYTKNYSGWYCVSDETFLTESQLKEDGKGGKVSLESGHPTEWTEELNYMFKLGLFQQEVVRWAAKEDSVRPRKFQKILLDSLEDDLPDISVSRPSSRVHWAIPVPGDSSQTIYVWLDALVNYLTCSGYPEMMGKWPPDVQVIGKDILKFHGIYWPAFLIANDLEPPRSLFVHSHWTVDDQKMSKSRGNVVDPMERASVYTSEGLRYFLLREGVAHSDGNYSDVKIFRYLNAELADTLGNLLSRCCAKSLNPQQIWPAFDAEILEELLKIDATKKLIECLEALPEKCFSHYQEGSFHLVVDSVMTTLHSGNNFFETMRPWELKKGTEEQKKRLEAILCLTMEALRITAIILQPIIPKMMGSLLDKLSVDCEQRLWQNSQGFLWKCGSKGKTKLSDESSVLFRRLQSEKGKQVATQ